MGPKYGSLRKMMGLEIFVYRGKLRNALATLDRDELIVGHAHFLSAASRNTSSAAVIDNGEPLSSGGAALSR